MKNIAPISIDKGEMSSLECNMPDFGSHTFLFLIVGNNIFIKYEDYPISSVAVGADLFAGTNCPYAISIVPSANSGEEVTIDNINEFSIGMEEK